MRALADNRHNEPDQLDARIARAKAEAGIGAPQRQVAAENRGWAVGIEFVGVVLVSAMIGWAIDNYAGLGTRPWAMIVMLVLGFAAGVRRALQTSSQFDATPDDNDTK
ncbi:AtpZ/AtpI family protein [Sphingomonas sp.]|uniref:AtpZ/AtpI family protein n=1 Tax=Sphingomonas sp. TaxID=28214 RepID=UPI001DA91E3D|nr:AtpZ/AtpI family protein [Sphingomonas sp.]MBX9796900.1 AtpZ/AtpI family protein [Sphingomonas sp.]